MWHVCISLCGVSTRFTAIRVGTVRTLSVRRDSLGVMKFSCFHNTSYFTVWRSYGMGWDGMWCVPDRLRLQNQECADTNTGERKPVIFTGKCFQGKWYDNVYFVIRQEEEAQNICSIFCSFIMLSTRTERYGDVWGRTLWNWLLRIYKFICISYS
jgi:hypothetical protein